MGIGPPASVVPNPAEPAPPRAPWDDAELLPPKPEEGEYGWRFHGKSHPCTRDELIERCRSTGKQYVELVWTPETARHVPPADVPWLIEPLRERARADLRHNLRIDVAVLLLGVLYVWYMWRRGVAVPPVYAAIFLLFAVVPAAQDVWALSRLRRSFSYLAEQAASLRYSVWLGTRTIVATYFVAGALVAVWASQVVVGVYRSLWNPDVRPSVAAAGLVKPAVHAGEWWRLLTAETLHGHWIHFALNLLSLMAVGRLLEVHAGPAYLPTVFLVSALTASLASLWLQPTDSVGASGAIMGLIGFLAVMGYRRRHVLPRGFMKSISLSIALTAGAGLVAHEVVDNAAHVGGLLGGVLLGFVYLGRRSTADDADADAAYRLAPSRPARLAGALAAVVLVGVTFWTIWLVLQSRLQGVVPPG